MWRAPGLWIALVVSALFIVGVVVMHRVFTNILKQVSEAPDKKASNHE